VVVPVTGDVVLTFGFGAVCAGCEPIEPVTDTTVAGEVVVTFGFASVTGDTTGLATLVFGAEVIVVTGEAV